MAQKSDREGLKNKYVDYLGNLIIDGKIKQDILTLTKTRINILIPKAPTATYDGVTITNNGDGTYTLNGTATAEIGLIIASINPDNNTYKITGCPPNGSESTYFIDISNLNNNASKDVGKGAEITLTGSDNYKVILRVIKGTVLENKLFKPMITTDLSATYDDFISSFDSLTPYTKMDLLWTNTSPASSFPAQRISLDLSRYKKIAIIFYYDINLQYTSELCFFEKVDIPQRTSEIYDQLGISRNISSITDTAVSFGGSIQTLISDGTYNVSNDRMVPYKIYGVI